MPKPRTLPETGPLADVKVGDKLIREKAYYHGDKPLASELIVVTKRTPKKITAGYTDFMLDGERVPGCGGGYFRLRLPEPGEVERIEEAARQDAELERIAKEEKARKRSTPEWQAADFLNGLGLWGSADDLLARFDHAALIQAAAILRAGENTKGEG